MSTKPSRIESWNLSALLSSAEMKCVETQASLEGLSGLDLMQRAGDQAAKIISKKYAVRQAIILCGPGNNGGDGYVCAEALRRDGWSIQVARQGDVSDLKGNAKTCALAYGGDVLALDQLVLGRKGIVVDALFGTGLSRPLDGVYLKVIEQLALSSLPLVALDLPSGVNADTGALMGVAPRAALTITFCRKKWGHLLRPGHEFCGEVEVADIGISSSAVGQIHPKVTENSPDLWIDIFPVARADGHKYSRGHALLYGGAVMTGAARLAARAAQRIGAGLLTLAASETVTRIYAEALESVIIRMAESQSVWKELVDDPKRDTVLIGPGLGVGPFETDLIKTALAARKPCVLDADVFTNFAGTPEILLSLLHENCVLTPHEGEFTRIFGTMISPDGNKLMRAREAAKLSGAIVLLKGAETIIASPDGRAIVNSNAPPWLATAGSGDVLSGLILGLLAQKMPPFAAAAAAAWVHGYIATEFGPGLIAEDLVAGIPAALKHLGSLP